MYEVPRIDSSHRDKGKELVGSSNPDRKKVLDLLRTETCQAARPVLSTRVPENLPSPETLEAHESETTLKGEANDTHESETTLKGEANDTLAITLLRHINTPQKIIEGDMRQRLTRITGNPDFLAANRLHTEVVKMRDAIRRKMQAYQHGQWIDYYSAYRDLSAAEATLAQEARMMNLLEGGVRRLAYIKNHLGANDQTNHDKIVKQSIDTLSADLSHIQEKQKETIAQLEKLKGDIVQCVVTLKQHAPDLPWPELDKALIFPRGKTKDKDEESNKADKEAKKNEGKNSTSAPPKKGDQLPSSDDHIESAAKTTLPSTLEISTEAKVLYKNLEAFLFHAQFLHGELTSLNNQWEDFVDKRKHQMDHLQSSYDMQSKRFGDIMNLMTIGTKEGKSDIANAMKYANQLVALTTLATGGGIVKVRI